MELVFSETRFAYTSSDNCPLSNSLPITSTQIAPNIIIFKSDSKK